MTSVRNLTSQQYIDAAVKMIQLGRRAQSEGKWKDEWTDEIASQLEFPLEYPNEEEEQFLADWFWNNFFVQNETMQEIRKSGCLDRIIGTGGREYSVQLVKDFIDFRNRRSKNKDPRKEKIAAIVERYCDGVVKHYGPCVSVTPNFSKCAEEILEALDLIYKGNLKKPLG
jgi:hypothetical protein